MVSKQKIKDALKALICEHQYKQQIAPPTITDLYYGLIQGNHIREECGRCNAVGLDPVPCSDKECSKNGFGFVWRVLCRVHFTEQYDARKQNPWNDTSADPMKDIIHYHDEKIKESLLVPTLLMGGDVPQRNMKWMPDREEMKEIRFKTPSQSKIKSYSDWWKTYGVRNLTPKSVGLMHGLNEERKEKKEHPLKNRGVITIPNHQDIFIEGETITPSMVSTYQDDDWSTNPIEDIHQLKREMEKERTEAKGSPIDEVNEKLWGISKNLNKVYAQTLTNNFSTTEKTFQEERTEMKGPQLGGKVRGFSPSVIVMDESSEIPDEWYRPKKIAPPLEIALSKDAYTELEKEREEMSLDHSFGSGSLGEVHKSIFAANRQAGKSAAIYDITKNKMEQERTEKKKLNFGDKFEVLRQQLRARGRGRWRPRKIESQTSEGDDGKESV